MQFRQVIPVNIVSGFLGSGKTTLVNYLLQHKPAQEHWAVVVNEFGAIGIDAAILSQEGAVAVEQVSGGCICCTGSIELQQAIIQIVRQEKPHRLIIEPSGLGQIEKVIDMLSEKPLGDYLDVRSIFCLIDPTQMTRAKVDASILHRDLVTVSDYLAFSKADEPWLEPHQAWQDWAADIYPAKKGVLTLTAGQLDLQLLDTLHSKNMVTQSSALGHHQHEAPSCEAIQPLITLPGLVQISGHEDFGATSRGWIFSPEVVFNWAHIAGLFSSLEGILRAKAVVRIGANIWQLHQWVNGKTTRDVIAYRRDSRIEIIAPVDSPPDWLQIEQQILAAMRQIPQPQPENSPEKS